MNNRHRIPTSDEPLHPQYIQAFVQYIMTWYSDPLFHQDFLYCCPFNKFLLEHFLLHANIVDTDAAWRNLFRFFSRTYTGSELANLLYEALHDLGKADSYLIFLKDHHYDYMLPDGEDFCDPSLKMP